MNKDQLQPPLLSYDVATKPSNVTVSESNNPSKVDILVTILPNVDVKCQYLSVVIPVGDESSELCLKDPIPTAQSSNPDWEPSSNNVVGMGQDAGNDYQTYLFKHTANDMTVNSAVTITVSGTVNQKTGKASIQVREQSCKQTESDFEVRGKAFDIIKTGEEAFFLNNVVIVYTDTPDIPAIFLDKNRALRLKWQSNGLYYRVYDGSQTGPISQGTNPWYDIPNGLTLDTTFIIEATSGDQILYQQYIALIKAPNLTVDHLSAKNAVTSLTGFFTDSLIAPGDTIIADAAITTLSTTGKATIADAAITTLSVTGSTDLTQGTITAFGSESLLATGQYIISTNYKAVSDGFVIASIHLDLSHQPDEGSIYLASVIYENNTYSASGATTRFGQGCNTVTVPIRKGGLFSIAADRQDGGNNVSGTTTFYWVGLGNGIPVEQAQKSEENQFSEKLKADLKAHQNARQLKALTFVNALEKAFEKPLQDNVKEELIQNFLKL